MKRSVLVVDDDPSGRAMLCLSLRQAGFLVRSAASGDDALRLLRDFPCRHLITDAKMSPMDGFELSRKARALKPKLHIAMVSAVCSELDIRGRPIEKCFPKPIPVDELVAWIADGRR